MAFKHLGSLRRRQKFLFVILILSSVLVLTGFINLFSSKNVDEDSFLFENRNLVQVSGINYDSLQELKTEVDGVILGPSHLASLYDLEFTLFDQSNYNYLPNNALMPLSALENPEIIYGRSPNKIGECVIDMRLVNKMLNDSNWKKSGLRFPQQIIGLKIRNYFTDQPTEIVGIVDTNNPNIYVSEEEYQIIVLNNYFDRMGIYQKFINESSINITTYYTLDDSLNKIYHPISELNLKPYEMLLTSLYDFEGKTKVDFGDKEINIVGYFENNSSYTNVTAIISDDSLEDLMFQAIGAFGEATVYTLDKKATINQINNVGYEAIDLYQNQYDMMASISFDAPLYTSSIVILIASLIFIYFIMRSSLISRVYEIGVYRALGVKKSNIYRLFASEILIITLLTSFIGIVVASYVIIKINSFYQVIFYPWYVVASTTIFIFGCNLLVGLMPIFNLLRLTPSQILSKYDI